jgi:hypothetical protein
MKDQVNSRVIKAREIKVVRNNKPVFHARQFSDSEHPEKNQIKVYKSNKIENEEEVED